MAKLTEEQKAKQAATKKFNADVKVYERWLESSLEECLGSCCSYPPPHRVLSVGDRVDIGNLEWNHVLEVLDEGRYVKVLTIPNVDANRSDKAPRAGGFRIWYRLWTDCVRHRTVEERLSPQRLVRNDDIRMSFSQRDVYALLSMHYSHHSGIDMDPIYQRGNVWTQYQKRKLIASIFNNVDIGKFAFVRRPFVEGMKLYEVLDGKQRLNAIVEFFEDRFKYQGMYFSEMNVRDQNHFEGYAISYGETGNLTEEQKLRYFIMLNTGGEPVSPDHMAFVRGLLDREGTEK